MTTAREYAQWIVDNADKRGTPDFDTVAKAFERTKAIERADFPAPTPTPAPPPIDWREAGLGTMVKQGFNRALTGLGSTVTDLIPALAGSALGFKGYAAEQLAENKAKMEASEAQNPTAFKSFRDIRGVGDAAGYVAETFGELIPDIIALMTGAGAASVVGKRVALKGVEKLVATRAAEGVAARGLEGEAAAAFTKTFTEKMAERAAPVIARAGAEGAATGLKYGLPASSYALNAPDVFQSIYEKTEKDAEGGQHPYIAAAMGVPIAMLDTFLPKRILDKLGSAGKAQLAEGILAKSTVIPGSFKAAAGKELLKVMGGEGLTEGAQEALTIAAEMMAGAKGEFFSQENIDRILNSSLKGAIGGGAFGGPGAIRSGLQAKSEKDRLAGEAAANAIPVETPQQALLALEDKRFTSVVFPDGSVATTPEQVKEYEESLFRKRFAPQPADVLFTPEDIAAETARRSAEATTPTNSAQEAAGAFTAAPRQLAPPLFPELPPVYAPKQEAPTIEDRQGEPIPQVAPTVTRQELLGLGISKNARVSGMAQRVPLVTFLSGLPLDNPQNVNTVITQLSAFAANPVVKPEVKANVNQFLRGLVQSIQTMNTQQGALQFAPAAPEFRLPNTPMQAPLADFGADRQRQQQMEAQQEQDFQRAEAQRVAQEQLELAQQGAQRAANERQKEARMAKRYPKLVQGQRQGDLFGLIYPEAPSSTPPTSRAAPPEVNPDQLSMIGRLGDITEEAQSGTTTNTPAGESTVVSSQPASSVPPGGAATSGTGRMGSNKQSAGTTSVGKGAQPGALKTGSATDAPITKTSDWYDKALNREDSPKSPLISEKIAGTTDDGEKAVLVIRRNKSDGTTFDIRIKTEHGVRDLGGHASGNTSDHLRFLSNVFTPNISAQPVPKRSIKKSAAGEAKAKAKAAQQAAAPVSVLQVRQAFENAQEIGRGGNAVVYDIPGTQFVLRVPNGAELPAPSAKLVPVADPFSGRNFGQPVFMLGALQVLHRQNGIPAGLSIPKKLSQEEADSRYALAIKAAAAMPQSAYDQFAADLVYLNQKGGLFDPSKSNNVLIDQKNAQFNLVDIAQGSKFKNDGGYIIITLMGNTYAWRYKGDENLKPHWQNIYKKAISAIEKNNLEFDKDSSSVAYSREFAGLNAAAEARAKAKAGQQVAADEAKVTADKAAADKAAADEAKQQAEARAKAKAGQQAAADKVAADKAKVTADKAAADKAAADKVTADKVAADKVAPKRTIKKAKTEQQAADEAEQQQKDFRSKAKRILTAAGEQQTDITARLDGHPPFTQKDIDDLLESNPPQGQKPKGTISRKEVEAEAAPAKSESVKTKVDSDNNVVVVKDTSETTDAVEAVEESDNDIVAAAVEKLDESDIVKLEKHYGEEADSEGFAAKLSKDIQTALDRTKGGIAAISKSIRSIIKQLITLILAVSVAFNPVAFNSESQAFNLPLPQTTTELTQIIDNPRADFGNVTPDATTAVLAAYVVGTNDNRGMPFIITDKPTATSYVFDAKGTLTAVAPVLMGAARYADVIPDSAFNKTVAQTTQAEKVTPAGRYEGKVESDTDYGTTFNFIQLGNSIIAGHIAYTGTPSEKRLQRLSTPTVDDNFISYGCLNYGEKFYRDHIEEQFKGGGIQYITPMVQTLEETFPGITAYSPTTTVTTVVTSIINNPQSATDVANHSEQGVLRQRPAERKARLYAAAERKARRRTFNDAFKRWFGNSKVVDADGNPLEVYHGTNTRDTEAAYSGFSVFKRSEYGSLGAGIYFTENAKAANNFAFNIRGNNKKREIDKNANVMPVYLKVENFVPDVLPPEWQTWIAKNIFKDSGRYQRDMGVFSGYGNSQTELAELDRLILKLREGKATLSDLYAGFYINPDTKKKTVLVQPWAQKLTKVFEDAGFDGLKVDTGKGFVEYLVFKQNQVKSVFNENPTSNPDIQYSPTEEQLEESYNTPLPAAAVTALENNDLKGALRALSMSKDSEVAKLAKGLLSANLNATVKLTKGLKNDRGQAVPGFYDPETNTLHLDPTSMTTHTVLHEASHSGLSHVIEDKNNIVTRQLNKLFNDVIPMLDGAYGAESLQEFVAEAQSNLEFRGKLNAMNPDGSAITAWQRFTNIVGNWMRRLMGNPTRSIGSALDKTDKLIAIILSPAPMSRDGGALYAAALYGKTELEKLFDSVARLVPMVTPAQKQKAVYAVTEFLTNTVRGGIGRAYRGALPLNLLADLENPIQYLVKRFSETERKRTGEVNKRNAEIEPLIKRAQNWAKAYPTLEIIFNNVVYFSTVNGVDPTKKESDYDAKSTVEKGKLVRPTQDALDEAKETKANWREVNAMYEKLNPEGQKLYVAMRNAYAQMYREILDALSLKVDAIDGITPGEAAEIKNKVFAELLAKAKLDPYFPLTREGNYWMSYLVNGTEGYTIEAFTSEAARSNRIRELLDKKIIFLGDVERDGKKVKEPNVQVYSNINQIPRNRVPSTSFVGAVLTKLDQKNVKPEVKEAVLKLFVDTLPETAFAKAFQNRKNTPGFERDAISALRGKMYNTSRQLANMKTASELEKIIAEAREISLLMSKGALKDAKGNYIPPSDNAEVAAIIEELQARLSFIANPKVPSWSQALTSIGFNMLLGANISSALVNLMQVPMILAPYLTGEHGIEETRKAITDAYKVFAGSGISRQQQVFGTNEKDTVKTGPSIINYAPDSENGKKYKTAIGIWEANAQLGSSMTYDVLDAPTSRINFWSGLPFHHAERINREVSLISAYNLEMARLEKYSAKTKDGILARTLTPEGRETAAANYAVYVAEMTQGGTSAASAPRYAQGPVGRVLLMFKRYGIMSLYLQFKMLKQSLDGATAAERKAAMTQFAGVTGMAALFAGLQGIPLFGMAALIYGLFKDDDDDDLATEVRKVAGPFWTYGPVSALTNLNVAGRLSQTDLLVRDMQQGDSPSTLATLGAQLLGPVYGVASKVERGLTMMGEGHLGRGIEQVLPSAFGNLFKAARFATEGANTLRGDPITGEVNAWNVGAEALGFLPADYARQLEISNHLKGIDKYVSTKETKLLRKYYTATRFRDFDEQQDARDALQALFRKHPGLGNLSEVISNSMASHQKTTSRMIHGVTFNAKLEGELRRRGAEME